MRPGFFVETLPAGQVGGAGKSIWWDLGSTKGAIKRAERTFGRGNFALWSFVDFYREETFKRVV